MLRLTRTLSTAAPSGKHEVNESTESSPEMNDDELSFWKRAFFKALPDCLDIERTPDFCAHIAAETADAAVREYRRRVK